MKPIFQHKFPGNIQQIAYFGTKDNLHIWVDVNENGQKKWFIVDVKSTKTIEIINPFLQTYVYTWMDAKNDKGFFSVIEQGKNPKPIGVFNVDLKTGTVLEKMDIFSKNLKSNQSTKEIFSIQHPVHYHKENSYFEDFVKFFKQKFNQQIDKGIDYLEGKDFLIFSYYLFENTWVNRLKVCNLSFEILWDELIESNNLIGHQTFQVIDHLLIYTKNKTELIILDNE